MCFRWDNTIWTVYAFHIEVIFELNIQTVSGRWRTSFEEEQQQQQKKQRIKLQCVLQIATIAASNRKTGY